MRGLLIWYQKNTKLLDILEFKDEITTVKFKYDGNIQNVHWSGEHGFQQWTELFRQRTKAIQYKK
jgi:hypothetical protein